MIVTPFKVIVIIGFVVAVLSCDGCTYNSNRTGSILPDVKLIEINDNSTDKTVETTTTGLPGL